MNTDLAGILAQEITNAARTDVDQAQANALNFYNCVVPSMGAGWSDLVSSDVRDAVESTVAEVMGAINTSEPLAFFTPGDPGDTEKAEIETWACHAVLFGANRGSVVLETAIRDALLQRYGVIKVWIETESQEFKGTIEGLSADQMAATLVELDTTGEDVAIDQMRQDGELYAADFTRTTVKRSLRIRAVAPENFRWSTDLQSCWLDEARFFAEECTYTRGELEKMKVRDANTAPAMPATDAAHIARHPEGGVSSQDAARPEDETVTAFWCYLHDYAKGGYNRHLFVMPATVMQSEWVEFHPYAAGVAAIRPHRFDGVSLFDRIGPIQETKTQLLRHLATQAKLTNQVRLAVWDKSVNPDDVGNDALNPLIRTTRTPTECIMPMPVGDITSQLLASLQWIDSLRREAGGASIDMSSPELQIAGQSAHAAEREYSFRELQSLSILRTLGETLVRSLYLVTHATLKTQMQGSTFPAMRGKEWVMADPQHWPERTQVVVDLGLPQGARMRRIGALQSTISQQGQTLQAGGAGLLVSTTDIYRAQTDLGKLQGLRNIDRYWTDPQSPEATQAAQAQAQQAQAAQQATKAAQDQIVAATYAIEKLKSDTDILKQRLADANAIHRQAMIEQQDYFAVIVKELAGNARAAVAPALVAGQIADASEDEGAPERGEVLEVGAVDARD